jgi:hypothetical protein
VLGAKELKSASISQLQADKTGNKQIDGNINDAISHINNSLAPTLWVDSLHLVFNPYSNWLNTCAGSFNNNGCALRDSDIDNRSEMGACCPAQQNGITVFYEEENAVTSLQGCGLQFVGGGWGSNVKQAAVPDFSGAIADLVGADQLLAKVAISDAQNASTKVSDPGRARMVAQQISLAQQEYQQAIQANSSGNFVNAIDGFGCAWMQAQLAMQFATANIPYFYQHR